MAYIAGIIILSVFFMVLHYFTELSKLHKIAVTITLFLIVVSAIVFNNITKEKQEKMLNIVTKFKQHKTITCNKIKVNDINYTLSIGTYTFIGKKNTPNYGIMISVNDCE